MDDVIGGKRRHIDDAQVGIPKENVFAQLYPHEKVDLISSFKLEGTTAMVGDGINDGPALAIADVGIAMGVMGTALAMETADISLFTNDLGQLAKAVTLAHRCRTKIIQNVVFSIIIKIIILTTSFTGYTGLWEAIVSDLGSALAVIFNGISLLDGPRRGRINSHSHSHSHGGKPCDGHSHKSHSLIHGETPCAPCMPCCGHGNESHGHSHKSQGHSHGDKSCSEHGHESYGHSHGDKSCAGRSHESHAHSHSYEGNPCAVHGHRSHGESHESHALSHGGKPNGTHGHGTHGHAHGAKPCGVHGHEGHSHSQGGTSCGGHDHNGHGHSCSREEFQGHTSHAVSPSIPYRQILRDDAEVEIEL